MVAGLGVVAFVVLFHNLGGFRSLGSHEGYAIVPAREMLESGDWVVPRFAGLPRLRKPPLAYWVIASSAQVFGELDEWSARFPAALSALLLSAVMGVWALRWYGTVAGLGAALVQMTSVYVVIYGRKAEVDMLLCLVTTACLFLVAHQPTNETRSRQFLRWTAVYGLISIAWLAKFHYGPAMVLAVCGTYFLVQRRFRQIWNLANPAGLLALVAAVLVWPWFVLQQLPEAWEIWREETLGRAVGDLGTEPLWYYVPHLVVLTLPWTPLIVAAIPRSWREAWKGGDARERFLWVWAGVQLAIVTVSADKHQHYLFATLPMFSLLAGRQFEALSQRVANHGLSISVPQAVLCAIVLLAGASGAAIYAVNQWPHLTVPAIAVSSVAAFGGCAALWLLATHKPRMAGLAAMCAFLGTLIGVHDWIMPGQDHRLPAVQFAREIRSTTPGGEIFAYGMGERNPVVFYLDSPVSRFESLEAVRAEMTRSKRTLILAYESDVDSLDDVASARELRRMTIEPAAELRPKHPPLVLLELTASPAALDRARAAATGRPQRR